MAKIGDITRPRLSARDKLPWSMVWDENKEEAPFSLW